MYLMIKPFLGNAMSRKTICVLSMACFLLVVVYAATSGTVSVSNTVNGKELPIYSVQTEEKKVALSFDAAGYDLANHSENHKNMSRLGDSERQEELMKGHTKVKAL